jgi:hypothetical protein
VLVPGVRTVASVLRVLGLAGDTHFVNFHRVLSRAVWSPRAAARVLLGLLVRNFVPEGPIVLGVDDTIERRRGPRIAARGIYRDPVRSSRSHNVQGWRAALAQRNAARTYCLGTSCVGAACADGPGAVRAP